MSAWSALPGPLLFAHRGAPAEAPENSLEAFALALEHGADVLEMDVHMTRDGQIVVAHDPGGARIAGVAREIRESTLAEVKSWELARRGPARPDRAPVRVPTLAEVLAAFPGALLNVDVKQTEPDMVPSLLSVVERAGAHGRVLLTSFHRAVTRRIRRLGYPGPTGLSRAEVAWLVFCPAALARRFGVAGQRLQIPLRAARLALDQRALIDKAHGCGLAVDYWVVNDVAQAERLLALGADGIVTDDPGAIAPLFYNSPRTAGWRERHPADS